MARRNKLWRFAQLQTFDNFFDGPDLEQAEVIGSNGNKIDLRGKWASSFFKNNNPITLELACGRGEYTLALAEKNPNRNYIGVDIKGARIYQGAKRALASKLTNVAFLRTRIEALDYFFEVGEIDNIWITFPDPFLKKGSINRRLTSPRFWNGYARMLKPNGEINLKTDDDVLYAYSKEVSPTLSQFKLVEDFNDIYSLSSLPIPELETKTYYEKKHLANGLTIKWLRWQRDNNEAPRQLSFSDSKSEE